MSPRCPCPDHQQFYAEREAAHQQEIDALIARIQRTFRRAGWAHTLNFTIGAIFMAIYGMPAFALPLAFVAGWSAAHNGRSTDARTPHNGSSESPA